MSNPWDRPPRLRPAHDVQWKTGLGRFVATLNPEAAIGDRLPLAGCGCTRTSACRRVNANGRFSARQSEAARTGVDRGRV